MTAGSDWLDQARRLLDAFVQGQATPAGASAPHGADCVRCPFCQAAAVVRGERPEVTAALADVLTTTATALRAFAESVRPAEPTTPAPTDAEPAAEPHPAVQRIEIA
jgi:LSD1 subclass zinc finger protein